MRFYFLLAILLGSSLPLWAAPPDPYKVEKVEACTDTAVAEPLRNALQPQGARLVSDKGSPVADLWLRRALPLKPGASGTGYNALAEGTFVGVVKFSAPFTDFRGQAIKPGVYTLRYAQIPSDGNHMGAAPSADFLLLVPAAADKDPEAQPKFDDLAKMSRQATSSNHPGVLMLTAVTRSDTTPALQKTGQGYWAVVVKTQGAKAGDFPLALVLIGKAEA